MRDRNWDGDLEVIARAGSRDEQLAALPWRRMERPMELARWLAGSRGDSKRRERANE